MRWSRLFPFAGSVDRLLSYWLEAIAPELWHKVHRRDPQPEHAPISSPVADDHDDCGEPGGGAFADAEPPRDPLKQD